MPTFEALLTEGASIPTDGWDFSWFDGRATEERPGWDYATLLSDLARRTLPHAAIVRVADPGKVPDGYPEMPGW